MKSAASGPNQLPDLSETLRRAAAFRGEELPRLTGTGDMKASFQVIGRALSDVVAYAYREGSDNAVMYEIGHYNPARDLWNIFPECVPSKRQASALVNAIKAHVPTGRRTKLAEAQKPGESFIDVHSPATRFARAQLAKMLEPLRPVTFAKNPTVRNALGQEQFIIGDDATPVIGIDSSTYCYPTLSTRAIPFQHVEEVGANDTITTTELEMQPGAALSLCYTGLIAQSPSGQGKMRSTRHVYVGHEDPDLGWIANPDVVTPEQWDILLPVAYKIREMVQKVPQFSATFCSVVYGDPEPKIIGWL